MSALEAKNLFFPGKMQNIPVQPTVIDYRVCEADEPELLSAEVAKALGCGYTVHGPLSVLPNEGLILYVQAMVKIELRPVNLGNLDSSIMPVSGILKP